VGDAEAEEEETVPETLAEPDVEAVAEEETEEDPPEAAVSLYRDSLLPPPQYVSGSPEQRVEHSVTLLAGTLAERTVLPQKHSDEYSVPKYL
jgi:hypothetical protein